VKRKITSQRSFDITRRCGNMPCGRPTSYTSGHVHVHAYCVSSSVQWAKPPAREPPGASKHEVREICVIFWRFLTSDDLEFDL